MRPAFAVHASRLSVLEDSIMACSRLFAVRIAAVVVVLGTATGCSTDLDVPTDLKCDATQTSCNLECTEGTCNASCQSTTGGCNVRCTGSSNCTCTGNTCNLKCETSGSCECKASICNKS